MNHIITLVKPQPFKYFGFILRRLGAIHSTPVDKKSGNAVDRIVETLSSNPKFSERDNITQVVEIWLLSYC